MCGCIGVSADVCGPWFKAMMLEAGETLPLAGSSLEPFLALSPFQPVRIVPCYGPGGTAP